MTKTWMPPEYLVEVSRIRPKTAAIDGAALCAPGPANGSSSCDDSAPADVAGPGSPFRVPLGFRGTRAESSFRGYIPSPSEEFEASSARTLARMEIANLGRFVAEVARLCAAYECAALSRPGLTRGDWLAMRGGR